MQRLICKETENQEISVRKQGDGDKGTFKVEDFAKMINEEVNQMTKKFLS